MKSNSRYWERTLLGLAALGGTLLMIESAAAQTWVTNTPMQVARWSHTATLLPNGLVLIAGGETTNRYDIPDSSFRGTASAELYDPSTGSSTLTSSMSEAHYSDIATLLPNGLVLVAGGRNDGGGIVTRSELYDPAAKTWTDTGDMNEQRSSFTATLLPNGQVLVVAGYTGNGEDSGESSSAEIYDPGTGVWTYAAPLNYAADSQTATLLTNGLVLVAGGSYNGNGGLTNSVLYNPVNNTWTNTGPLNEARAGHAATLLPNGTVLVVGGAGDNTCEIFNPATATWSIYANMNDGWQNPNAVLLNNGQVMVTGDDNSDVELYDPSANTWSYADSLPVTGYSQVATLLSSGQVLVTGGDASNYNGPALNAVQTYGSAVVAPGLNVTASPTSGLTPLTVQFSSPSTDSDGNTVTNWNWDFGDGGTSMAQNPSHTYNNFGGYSPSLTAYSTFGATPLNVTGLGVISVTNSPGMWTLTDSLTNAVRNQTATLLPNGKVLLAGGYNYSGNVFAAAELYDPVTGTWAGTQPLNLARAYHTATLLNNGLVLVAGGATNPNGGTGATTSAELYNPTNGTWTLTGSMHTPRFTHSATLLPSGKVLVAGGQSTNAYPNIIASAELYDPATGQWTTINPMATQRYSHTATLLPNGKVLIAGGGVTNALLVTGACELYDPATGNWSSTGYMTYPLVNHTATLLSDGTVLVAGGDFDEGGFGGVSLVPSFFAMLYDPVAGTWSSTASMLSVRDYHTATLLNNGLVLVAGDEVYGVNPTNSAELYIPSSKTWVRAAAMNVPRQFHTATLLNNGQVLAAGGVGNSGVLASAELFNSVSTPAIILLNPQSSGANFQFQFLSQSGFSHNILYRTNLVVGNWLTNSTVTGDGTVKTISIPYSLFSPSKQVFIRASTQ
jgi:N-acetylneuraminic acid mutarotase